MDIGVGLLGLAAALSIAIATIAPALAQGNAAARAMEAIARQPEAAGEIRTSLIISLAFMEALTIYGLLIAFLILGNIG
ncbi:MAG: ATP synthase F0 subunit C [Clostridia bacterium]|nr:ATP synthase F0 subunit C [Clostridia bacterium]